MGFKAEGWFAQPGGGDLVRGPVALDAPASGEVIVEVDACGLCHTDLGYASGQVAPKHPLPLVLGHEVVGRVVAHGSASTSWAGARVLVPAVLPCGDCPFCAEGRGNACQRQKMPGNDIHGGFASHLLVPAAPLVRIEGFEGGAFRALGVVADAVSTAYQAVKRASLKRGDIAVVVGVGGVGAFLAQIAKALGAHVIACDVSPARLELAQKHGAERTFLVGTDSARDLKRFLADFAKELRVPSLHQQIFECSGHVNGQSLAYAALPHGGTVTFVGYTIEKVQVRLSNLMALDATAHGSWGCPPQLYPEVLRLIREGAIQLDPFLDEAPMSRINELLLAMGEHRLERRMVLVPDFH
jgi:6-hydroxycyclohex-1-ene-1-carbonyl-CoA dehydrogenase